MIDKMTPEQLSEAMKNNPDIIPIVKKALTRIILKDLLRALLTSILIISIIFGTCILLIFILAYNNIMVI